MDMDDDIDLSLSPVTSRKPGPKQGRRAAFNDSGGSGDLKGMNRPPPAPTDLSFGSPLKARRDEDELFLDGPSHGRGTAPPRGRRTGGWAEERSKTAKSVRIQSAVQIAGGFGPSGLSDDDDMPVIPDLDEVQEEDMTMQVAAAPSVAVNRVATYRELDNDLLKHVAFATLDDIDLRLLTRRLAPESAVRERDEPWSWDVVFAEVSSELQKEWFPEEEEEEKQMAAKERPYTAFNRFPV